MLTWIKECLGVEEPGIYGLALDQRAIRGKNGSWVNASVNGGNE